MKIAMMSDVHGNPKAFLRAISDAMDCGCRKIYLLGDIVGYGYDPNACIDIAKRECAVVLKGNHDAGLLGELDIEWFSRTARNGVLRHRKQVVDKGRLEWLRTRPLTAYEPDGAFAVTHGTVGGSEEFNYISTYLCSYELSALAKMDSRMRIIFCGHTHDAFAYTEAKVGVYASRSVCQADLLADKEFDVGEGYHVFNIGSVGYPRVLGKSVYAIYDTESRKVRFRFLKFDLEEYARDLEKCGIMVPCWLGSMLDGGW